MMRSQKSPSEYGFNHFDLKRLQRGLEQVNDKQTFLRLKAVLLIAQGTPITQVIHLTAKSKSNIYHLVKIYLSAHQVTDLFDKPKSGRPATAISITKDRILKALEQYPSSLGYSCSVWTVKLLAQHLGKRYHCAINKRTLRRRMKAIGLSYKRPKYVYSEKIQTGHKKRGYRPKVKPDASFSCFTL